MQRFYEDWQNGRQLTSDLEIVHEYDRRGRHGHWQRSSTKFVRHPRCPHQCVVLEPRSASLPIPQAADTARAANVVRAVAISYAGFVGAFVASVVASRLLGVEGKGILQSVPCDGGRADDCCWAGRPTGSDVPREQEPAVAAPFHGKCSSVFYTDRHSNCCGLFYRGSGTRIRHVGSAFLARAPGRRHRGSGWPASYISASILAGSTPL